MIHINSLIIMFKREQPLASIGEIDAPNGIVSCKNRFSKDKLPNNSLYSLKTCSSKKRAKVIVEAPASIANLGPGFDILAIAIDKFKDTVELAVKPGSGRISIKVEGIRVPEGRENVAYGVIEEAISKYGLYNMDFEVKIDKKIPPSLGLGSSGATSAATAYALSIATGLNLNVKELIKLAGAGEVVAAGTAHYDNVSASILGGIVLIDPADIGVYKLKFKRKFWITIVSPNIPRASKKTLVARSILPGKIELSLLVKQSASIAKLIYALHVGDIETMGNAISSDYVVEPYRAKLIPEYWSLKKIALENGALGFNIAGAGPSIFSICENKTVALRIGRMLTRRLKSSSINAVFYVTKVSEHGAKAIER